VNNKILPKRSTNISQPQNISRNISLGMSWLDSLPPWDGKNFAPLEVPLEILNRLGNPQNSYKTIHLAGTNGKGSVSTFLATILLKEFPEKSIGLMTSPHIVKVEERAKINLLDVDSTTLSEAILAVKKVCEEGSLHPTYFVAITCAIFYLFKIEKVDYAVIETGLGGRYDATNVIENPLLCLITSLGFDHEEQLGSTIDKIAWNKGGIVKESVPLICGVVEESAKVVLREICSKSNSSCIFIDEESKNKILAIPDDLFWKSSYQEQNAKLAAFAASYLSCSLSAIIEGLSTAVIQGRLQYFPSGNHPYSPVLLDAAHNASGIESRLAFVKDFTKREGHQSAVFLFSFMARKNWKSNLEAIKASLQSYEIPVHLIWTSFGEGAVCPNELQTHYGGGEVVESFSLSLERSKPDPFRLLIVAGSFKMLELFCELDYEQR